MRSVNGSTGAAVGITLRLVAAAVGGYGLAYTSTAFLSVWLPLARTDRVMFASLASFAVYTVAILYAFAARSAWRACWVLSALCGVLALGAFLPGGFGARA
ncbi:DUF3649 domain-containing protein [Stigmatella aurantiaca]|uniref:Iron uptake protein n=1 Tax=Stigmatella aurantiaca (strain DW4/3-1) TaxID=378806 RepID=Q08YR5_STIAD|nr:DUF3649 domain-containing protein [Stigmatella aurantiaca]ADO72070.1 uncharacterized protein STAUR_4290 [Stigmatella aurantiaca DW4/3-1]EAU65625.1 conserved hypothetical protein [Stigmatella aurantiaca DW4/3-1]